MAINTGVRTSFTDRTNTVKDNIDDRLDFLTPTELPFLNYLGFMSDAGGATGGANSLSFPCTQQRHNWLNDDLIPSVSLVATAYTAAGGSLVITTGEGGRFDDEDVIMVAPGGANANHAVMYALVTNVTTDTLTISELESTGVNCAVGDIVYLLGNARVEGTAASVITARTVDFGSTENFTQIFMAKVDIAGSDQSTERWGMREDPVDYQVTKRLKELAIQLERVALYSIRNATYPSTNSTRHYMGGLAYFIRDNATNQTNGLSADAAGADLDEVLLNNVLEDVWDQGGMPDTIMVSARQKRMIDSFLVPSVRTTRTEGTAGVIVGAYESNFGTLDVVLNRWIDPSDLIICTREYLGLGPLAGNGNSRAFFAEDLPKDGDYERKQIIGEYTMEVRNNTKAHGWIRNLSRS